MAAKKKRISPPIHSSIREALGYKPSDSDKDIYADWKERKTRVCKPCWELKYCPYGPFVEQSPLLPVVKEEKARHVAYLKECVRTGLVGTVTPITPELREQYEEWSRDDQLLLQQAWFTLRQRKALEAAAENETEDEQIKAWLGSKLPPIHVYRVPFSVDKGDLEEKDFSPEVWQEIQRIAEEKRVHYVESLAAGQIDNRTPLESARRALFKRTIEEFIPEDHPAEISETFTEAECNIYGHICPVFFAAEEMTELEERRRIGRRQLSFTTMMRIVRRDDYRCQHCKKKLRDDEVEFDHIIPISKGGSSEEHNLRLTCFDCNRDKSDEYTP